MRPGLGGSLLVGLLMVGCATSRVVHLDTGQGSPIAYTPRQRVGPVEVDSGEFKRAMAQLILDLRFSLRPTEATRSRLQLVSWDERTWDAERGGGCTSQSVPDECLTLLGDGFSLLDAASRRNLALSFAWDGVWSGVHDAVRNVVNPLALKAMISSAMAAYMFLVLAPEPLTKFVAIALTAYVIAYMGLESFENLVDGWTRLSSEAERAVSLQELETAGSRFGAVMGTNGARVLILALTMALGGGAANIATKGPLLPGFARATLAIEANAGVQLSAALGGGVRSISWAPGVLTVGLAPTAVAATAMGANTGESAGASVTESRPELKHVFNGVRNAPGFPANFKAVQNGTTRNRVDNKDLLEKLREIEPGDWVKVYKDGWVGTDKVSLHYFESASGKVFNFKMKPGWSNQ
nr:hypothetical protein [Myxococcus sp. CA039A]